MAARLSTLAGRLDDVEVRGGDALVTDAVHDSRQVRPGVLFCAVRGRTTDGHDHAATAVEAGATALLVERSLDLPVPQLIVPSVRRAMGPTAAGIHDDPADELRMVGVTGTNGKTTVTFLLESAMAASGWGSGRIGTLGWSLHGRSGPGGRTTPEATDLQRLLRDLRTCGADGVAMEVSSHGLDLHRVDGMVFDVAVFTNLTQDHLDWHGTMDAYRAAKARLFTPELARHAVLHVDAPGTRELLELVRIPTTTIGCDADVDVRVSDRHVGRGGSGATLLIDGEQIRATTVMRGPHNLDNLIVATVAAVRAGMEASVVVEALADVPAPAGRLEPFGGGEEPLVLVDYAHTPDAVAAAVAVGRDLLSPRGRLFVLVGAGGERDREKRAPMGAAAAAADLVVVTDDNPRSEDPEAIRAAVILGVRSRGPVEVLECADRRRAVSEVIARAVAGDVVLVLGRGHESHQEVGEEWVPLDDRDLVRGALESRRGAWVGSAG